MGLLFDGINDSLQATLDLSSINKFTLSLWLYWDSFSDNDDLAMEFTADAGSNAGGFYLDPNNSLNSRFQIFMTSAGPAGSNYTQGEFTRPSGAAWHQYVFHFDMSTADDTVAAWVDGASQTIIYIKQRDGTGNFANSTLNFMSRNNTALFGAGRMAEVALWPGILLDVGEVAALAAGVSPLMIRPTVRPWYWPLIGNASPEIEYFHQANATIVGAVPTPHPRIIYPNFIPNVTPLGTTNATISPTATLSMSGGLTQGVSTSRSFAGTVAPTGALAASLPRTRLYFSSALGASASPAYDAGWNYITEAARWRLKHTKGASALADGTQIGAWTGTAGQKALDRQYVSNPLNGAQSVGGSIKGQLLVQEVANTDNVDQIISVVKVVSIDGGTLRGTVLSSGSRGPTGEFRSTGFRNKIIADGDGGSIVAAQDGDRIVIEIGYSNSTAGTTPEAFARWGENASDLPENETQTTDGAGWIEFAGSLSFQADAAGGLETGGTLSSTGSLKRQAQLPRGGTLSPAGTLTPKLTSRRSLAGTLTTFGSAVIFQVFLTVTSGTFTVAGTVLSAFARGVLAAGTLGSSGILTRLADKVSGLAGTLTTAGAIARTTVIKAPDAELTVSGDMTPLKLFNATGGGTLAPTGVLRQQVARLLSGALSIIGTLRRTFGQALSGVLSFFGIVGVSQSAGTVGVCPLTVADLIARVYERLDADDGTYYTLPEVAHALDMAQRLFAWLTLCLEHRASFSLQAGQAFPSIHSNIADLWVPLRVSLQTTGARLLPVALDDLDKLDDDWQNTAGTPRYYCMMGFDFMAVYPQPSAPVTLHVTYAAEPQQITQFGGVLEVPSDAAPLLVDGAIWILRLKEGGPELQSTLENLDRFVKGVQRYRQYIESRSKAQLYDSVPAELRLFDLSRFKFKKPPEARQKK